jgi:hypothetical protein
LKYPGTNNFVDLANYPAAFGRIVRKLGPKILFFNTDDGPNQILGSKDDDIEAWDPVTHPTAIELTVRDFNGPMIAVEPLGEALAVYGNFGMHLVRYGGPFLITAKKGPTGVKAVSANSIAARGNVHYGIQESGLFVTDGSTVQMIADKQLGSWLIRNVDWGQKSRIATRIDAPRNHIHWTLPLLDGTNKLLGLNYVTGNVFLDQNTYTCAARVQDGLTVPVYGTATTDTFMLLENPQGRLPELTSRPFPLNKRMNYVMVEGLIIRLVGMGLTVCARFGNSLDEFTAALPWTVLGTVSMLQNLREQIFWHAQEAVFMQIKLVGDQGVGWRLTGIDVLGSALRGKRF